MLTQVHIRGFEIGRPFFNISLFIENFFPKLKRLQKSKGFVLSMKIEMTVNVGRLKRQVWKQ